MKNSDWRIFFASQYKEKYKDELYSMLIAKISDAIANNLNECVLFDSKIPPYLCVINESEYGELLEHCIEIFVETEEYEFCSDIVNLINQLQTPVIV